MTIMMIDFILMLFVTGFINQCNTLPQVIKIAAIFEKELAGSAMEHVFRYTVHKINQDKSILPATQLMHDIQYVSRNDSFHAGKTVCSQLNGGAQAIFGPCDSILASHVQSICDALDIPHLEWRLDYDSGGKEFSVNLYPSQTLMNKAVQDLINYLNWTRVAVIYEQNHGLTKLRELMRLPGLEVFVRQVEPHSYLSVLREIKEKEYYNLIIDTNPDFMNEFLKGILQLQMNEYKYHYFFTSFDIETFEIEDFKYNFVNITAFRLVDLSDIGVKDLVKDMERYYHFRNISIFDTNHYIKTKSALIYDSVYVFAIALHSLVEGLELSNKLRTSNVSCTAETPWNGGLSLVNYINGVEWKGLTGPIEFKEGRRIKFKLDLIKLKHNSVVSVGEWLPDIGLNVTDRSAFFESSTMNVNLVVITILETPYVMMHNSKNYTGNARFYGFCVDILDRVAQQVGFDYILDLVPDRKYGAKDPITGEWNGMVHQLMKHKADLAVGSMTINYARESVIDFTKPFMNLGISILFKVPASPPSRLFSFMKPLSNEIWICVFFSYILVSITVYIVAHFSPNEWRNPHPCEIENNLVENQFSISNSFWFTIGTLMQTGSDLNPQATSTRIVSGIWWFFTLIMISSYTANLAAFLTVERMITPIENAEDLASQTEIAYGTLDSGSTMTFFQDSLIETYKKMWRFMENRKPTVFTSTYEEGIRRVLQGNYAFLMESTMLDYIVQRDCNLTQIGGLLDSKGYGIATSKGSPWRDKISLAILEMQEKGEIQMLYDKWWKKRGVTCEREDKNKNHKAANALGVDNIGGVFVVLLCGLALAVTIAILEFCQKSNKDAYNDPLAMLNQRQSLCAEMTEELCFALCGPNSQKRPALKRKCSKCMENNSGNLNKPITTPNNISMTYNRRESNMKMLN